MFLLVIWYDKKQHTDKKQMSLKTIVEQGVRTFVPIWYEHECPGWSFDVSMNVRGGHLMWARMSGPVKNRVGTNVRGNECPGFVEQSIKLCWD